MASEIVLRHYVHNGSVVLAGNLHFATALSVVLVLNARKVGLYINRYFIVFFMIRYSFLRQRVAGFGSQMKKTHPFVDIQKQI